jgi:cytochrome c biogenesis protein CcmG/thiol:disulfide interchange protein DsbE
MAPDRSRVTRRGRGTPLRPGRIRPPDLSRLPRWWLAIAAVVPLVLVALIAAGWGLGAGLATPVPRVGDRAPEFSLADLDGTTVSLADYRGQTVLVNFWASWCLPCVDEFPVLGDALDTHADAGLAMIGIVYRDRSEAARAFADQFGAGWPMVMDPGEAVARAYGVYGPPESWIIGPDGRILSRQIGPYHADELEAELDRVLGTDETEE